MKRALGRGNVRVALFALVPAVGDVDGAVVGDVERLRPVDEGRVGGGEGDVGDLLARARRGAIARRVRHAQDLGLVLIVEIAAGEEQALGRGQAVQERRRLVGHAIVIVVGQDDDRRLASRSAAGRDGLGRGNEQLAAGSEAQLAGVADLGEVVGAEADGQAEEAEVRRIRRAAGDDGDAGRGALHRAGKVAETSRRRDGCRGCGRLRRVGRSRKRRLGCGRGRRRRGGGGVCEGRGRARRRPGGTAAERRADGADELVDGRAAVAVAIHRGAGGHGLRAEGDVDAGDEVVDAHRPVAGAVADAPLWSAGGGATGSEADAGHRETAHNQDTRQLGAHGTPHPSSLPSERRIGKPDRACPGRGAVLLPRSVVAACSHPGGRNGRRRARASAGSGEVPIDAGCNAGLDDAHGTGNRRRRGVSRRPWQPIREEDDGLAQRSARLGAC